MVLVHDAGVSIKTNLWYEIQQLFLCLGRTSWVTIRQVMLAQVHCITGHSCHRKVSSHSEAFPSFSCGGGAISNTERTAQTALCLVPDDSSKEDGVEPANSGSSGKPTFCWRSGTAGGSALPSPDASPPGRARPPPLPIPSRSRSPRLCRTGTGRPALSAGIGRFSSPGVHGCLLFLREKTGAWNVVFVFISLPPGADIGTSPSGCDCPFWISTG